MRIHSLEITGFGPFKDTQKIDFNALSVDRIFMLEGPTGSGKSSIIDAIVWVLYGNTAQQAARKASNETGGSEFGDRVHSDYLKPEEDTRVVMEFSVNQARYRVTRTKHFVPKKKGSEELVPKPTERLEFIDPPAEPLTKEIYPEVYRILQMEAAQFSQLMVMPQAAFDTFLRAKSEARGDVLKKIFRTYYYEKLGIYLNNRGKEIKKSLEAERTSIDFHVRNMGDIAKGVSGYDIDIDEELKYFRLTEVVAPRTQKDAHLAEIVTALTPDTAADLAEKERLEKLIAPIGEQITKLKDSLEKIKDKVKKTTRLAELTANKPKIDELEAKLDAIAKASKFRVLKDAVTDAQDAKNKAGKLNKDLEGSSSQEIQKRIDDLEPKVKALATQVAQQDGLGKEQTALKQELEIAESVEEAQKESPKLQKELEGVNTKIAAQKKKNKEYESKRAESWVHEAATKLKKGQPCPVCGSKEHPKPVAGKGSFDEDTFEEMEQVLEDLETKASDLKESIAYYKPFLNKQSKSSAEIKKEISDLQKRITEANDVQNDYKKLETEIELLRKNLPVATALEAATTTLEKAQQKFTGELEKAGLDAKALDALLSANEAKIKSEIEAYNNEITSINSILAQEDYLKLPASSDELDDELKELNTQIGELKTQLSKVDARISLSQDRMARINTANNGIQTGLNNLEEIIKRDGAVMQLDQLVDGTNPEALKLIIFVLQERLQMILERASLHLLKISNGKFEFKLSEEKGASRKNAGLDITVIDHMAGRERPAETLSGGETFYASLSLCLGLAEVVKMDKGGIELGMLFIDEGFGSLSSDKLSEVLDVLDKLRDNGRIIGIITHLEDMKAQIPLRLEVARSDEGPSYVRMAVGSEI